MQHVVYCALYVRNAAVKSPNILHGNTDVYYKGSYVTLKSAKLSNPDTQVVLVTNQLPPDPYASLFSQAGIKIAIVPFDKYTVPSDFRWEYAFYKLKALEHMVCCGEYDCILGLDTDVYVQSSLQNLWQECRYDLPILYELDGYSDVRSVIESDYEKLFHEHRRIVQVGGEFLAGSRTALSNLLKEIDEVYTKIQASSYDIDKSSGDEAILSMAASAIRYASARPFMRRYWTRKACYDTDFQSSQVPVWHLPAEKNFGLLIAFRILKKGEHLPSYASMRRLFNLPKANIFTLSMLTYYGYRIMKTLADRKHR